MKNSKVTIGNRTRDIPACSAVPQPTATPRAPISENMWIKLPALKDMTNFSLVESFRSVYFTPSSTVRQYFLRNVGTLLPDDTVYNIIGQQSTHLPL